MRIALLHTRIRAEERLLIEALDARGIETDVIDVRSFVLDPAGPGIEADAVLDRSMSVAASRAALSVLERSGVKRVIHGPFTFAPDGNPLVGPVPGLRNYWSACAVMAGFSQGGGVGLSLAQWMVEGEPERDVFAMDVARFGELRVDRR
ncbi:MAG: hypothetical protein AAFU70_04135, partial [Planctomycetota bacterium]